MGEIMHALQSDPERLRSWVAIVRSPQMTAEARHHLNEYAQRRWFGGLRLLGNDAPNGAPLFQREDGITGKIRISPTQPGHIEDTPGHDQVQRQTGAETIDVFQLPFFDVAAGLEHAQRRSATARSYCPIDKRPQTFPRAARLWDWH